MHKLTLSIFRSLLHELTFTVLFRTDLSETNLSFVCTESIMFLLIMCVKLKNVYK